MNESAAADFGAVIAERMRAEHVALSARWLERLLAVVPLPANQIFPSDRLLDHIPDLIREIAAYVEAPSELAVAANTDVIAKAQQLGELRHSQQASIHQLLAEYRLLGSILSTFMQEEFERLGLLPEASAALELDRRLQAAMWILLQTTVDTFVAEYTATIANHASRLESFNRMVSHELRQPIAALVYAVPLLNAAVGRGDGDKQAHLLGIVERNVRGLMDMLQKLEIISRMQAPPPDRPDVQRIELASVGREVARQLREMADARDVQIRIADDLPAIEVDIARVELILVNLVSNALKYSDRGKPHRFVAIEAEPAVNAGFCTISVRDNGIGIPAEILPVVFGRFVRAHADRDDELGVRGSGLGLSIVAECVEAVGGTIAIDSTVDVGTTVSVTLPTTPVSR